MSLLSIIRNTNAFINISDIQKIIVRCGHQMSTRNRGGSSKNKYRGMKCGDSQHVHEGQFLFTQLRIKFHPGMNVRMASDNTLVAMVSGTVKISGELFDPNFDNAQVVGTYSNREGQKIYKKYFNIIPDELPNKFKLIDVV